MSIFGDETITPSGVSPDLSGQDDAETAGDPGNDTIDNDQDLDNEDIDNDEELDGDDGEQDDPDDDEDGEPPADGQGEKILGKFRTQKDLETAYINLQREFTKSRQGGGQPASGQQPAQQQAPVADNGQPDPNQAFWDQFKDNPLQAIMSVAAFAAGNQIAPYEEKQRAATVAANIKEIAKEYRQAGTQEGLPILMDKVREIAEDMGNPSLADYPSPRVLRMAAQEAWGDTKAQAFKKGKDAARAELERNRQNKQGLGAKSGARQQKGDKTPEQSMKDAILAAGRGGGGIFG